MHICTLLTCDSCGSRVEWPVPVKLHSCNGGFLPYLTDEDVRAQVWPDGWRVKAGGMQPLRTYCCLDCVR